MKKISLILVAVLFLVCIFLYYSNNNPQWTISMLLKRGEVKPGELNYKVNLLGILPVAKATFNAESIEDYKNQKVYHLKASAVPLNIYSRIFKGYAHLDAYVDMQTYNPLLFKEEIFIPDRKNKHREVFYNQKNLTMTVDGIKRQILPNTKEPLSIILSLRHMKLDNIKDLEMNINTNQKNYILKATVQVKDLSLHNRKYRIFILKAKIHRRDRNSYHKSYISTVLLKGKENIPVLIKVFASGILLNAKLVEIKQ